MIQLSFTSIILLAIAFTFLIILSLYYLFIFSQALKVDSKTSDQPPVSVIIAARNEFKNLQNNLASILGQNYPNYEVVVINDCSFDGTKDYLDDLAKSEPKLKIVTLAIDERFQKGKKFALTMGIKAATHERLLFTDADCRPAGDEWIATMAKSFVDNTITLGIAPLKTKKNLLGSIINYETLHTAIQYLGYARRNEAYMGVGRNLSYTKTIFFENKGFARHQHIMSGDDDLFVQQAAKSVKVNSVVSSNSFMYSNGPSDFGEFFKQKIRHLSTGKEYLPKYKMRLGIYSISQIMLYFTLISFLIYSSELWYLGVAILLTKWLIQWIVIGKIAIHLDAKKVAYALPYYDILYNFFLLTFGVAQVFIKPKTWN
jgi:biofilm PGA synthesis N-glycosyltransferase PgaC